MIGQVRTPGEGQNDAPQAAAGGVPYNATSPDTSTFRPRGATKTASTFRWSGSAGTISATETKLVVATH